MKYPVIVLLGAVASAGCAHSKSSDAESADDARNASYEEGDPLNPNTTPALPSGQLSSGASGTDVESSGMSESTTATASDSPQSGTQAIGPARDPNPNTVDSNPAAPAANPAPVVGQPVANTTTREPDNTEVNKRDRADNALTPMAQGNGETDLKITQQIRQAVMKADSLSFTAKNVKIITADGRVTLRGTVKSEQERSTIDGLARNVAGAAQVTNQLEIEN